MNPPSALEFCTFQAKILISSTAFFPITNPRPSFLLRNTLSPAGQVTLNSFFFQFILFIIFQSYNNYSRHLLSISSFYTYLNTLHYETLNLFIMGHGRLISCCPKGGYPKSPCPRMLEHGTQMGFWVCSKRKRCAVLMHKRTLFGYGACMYQRKNWRRAFNQPRISTHSKQL